MGENKNIKELDAFVKKFVKDIPSQKAPIDFTSSVMKQVAQEKVLLTLKSKPLISKKIWLLIAATFLGVLMVVLQFKSFSFIKTPEINISFLKQLKILNLFNSVDISNTVLLSLFLFMLLFLGQIIFLKNHFNKKLT